MTQTTVPSTAPRAAELDRGVEDRTTGGDHVFDDAEPRAVDVTALRELAGAVRLRFLADEAGRPPGDLRQHRGERHPAELEPGQRFRVGRHERREGDGEVVEQRGVGLEAVLVEVLRARHTRTQRERPGEVRRRVHARGKRSRIRCGGHREQPYR